jgi:hypothetical protein
VSGRASITSPTFQVLYVLLTSGGSRRNFSILIAIEFYVRVHLVFSFFYEFNYCFKLFSLFAGRAILNQRFEFIYQYADLKMIESCVAMRINELLTESFLQLKSRNALREHIKHKVEAVGVGFDKLASFFFPLQLSNRSFAIKKFQPPNNFS